MLSRITKPAGHQSTHSLADPAHVTLPAAASNVPNKARVLTLQEGNNTAPIALTRDEALTLELFNNDTTGYRWHLESSLPQAKKTCMTPEPPPAREPLLLGDQVLDVYTYGGTSKAYHYTWQPQDLPTDGKPFKIIAEQRRSSYCGVRNQGIRRTEFTFVRPAPSWLASYIYPRRR